MFIHSHTFGHLPYIWTPPICSESFNRVFCNIMFSYFRGSHGGLSDLGGVHMPPMVIQPHMFGHPQYVQSFNRVFILLFHGVVRLRGYPYAPLCSYAPCMFQYPHLCGHPPYVWTPPMFVCPQYIWGYPNVWGMSTHMGASKHTGGIWT